MSRLFKKLGFCLPLFMTSINFALVMDNLKQTTVGALVWNLLDRFGQQVLQFAVAIIVANILFPDDYAVVAMLAIFTAVGNLIVESGFGAALIQRKDADETDFSTVFWFNLVMSLALYGLLMAAMPLIVAYFQEPQLEKVGAVVFLALPVNASMLIQTTLLNKQIRFRQLAKIDLSAMVVSSVVAVAMAVAGFGVWTLAWQPVTLAMGKSVLLWTTNDWRPRLSFSLSRLRKLFGFASSLLVSGLINTCFVNVYSLVIPKLYPKRELGYFTQGNKISDPIVSLVYGSIQNATYPIFSHIQNERVRLINAYRKSIRLTSLLTFPLMVGGMVTAPQIFRILFKSAWWPAIPYFQLLCVGGCFTVLTAINNNFIKVSGRSSGILKTELCKILFTVVAVAVLMRHSVLAMVAGLMAVRAMVHVVGMAFTHLYTGYGLVAQTFDTLPYLLLAAVMGVITYSLSFVSVLSAHPWLLLGMQIVVGVGVYIGLAYLTGSKILREALQLLKKR